MMTLREVTTQWQLLILQAYLGTAEQLASQAFALSFVRAFVAALIVGLAGLAAVPDLSAAKALVVAASRRCFRCWTSSSTGGYRSGQREQVDLLL
jgi:hypothetical protein